MIFGFCIDYAWETQVDFKCLIILNYIYDKYKVVIHAVLT